jgi:hypothetical protein
MKEFSYKVDQIQIKNMVINPKVVPLEATQGQTLNASPAFSLLASPAAATGGFGRGGDRP